MMIATTLRQRWSIAGLALVAGIAVATAIAMASGVFTSPSSPLVSRVEIALPVMRDPVYVSDLGYYKGWGTVAQTKQDYYRFIEVANAYEPQQRVPAYRWNGSSWSTVSRTVGTQVYVWPYATDWSWTWTAATGWLAMRDNTLIARYNDWAVAT